MGVTYGARTSFDLRRVAGVFSCDTNVQADRTAESIHEILTAFDDVAREDAIPSDELDRAKATLTRGYVRHFETASQLVRAAGQLVTLDLDDDAFDRFVPAVDALTADEVREAAAAFVRARDATVVVVGDAGVCQRPLEHLGRPVAVVTPEF
jgi:predicted Zn-dependent peptidase